jgi:hypothetical protein
MVRRCLYIAFVVIVPLAVVLIAGWSIVMKDRWAKRRLHELLTVQAAQTLDAEVRVGGIDGNILTGLKITDLAISEGRSLAESTLVSVDEVALEYDLWPVIRREVPPVESVREVRISGLRGKLSRDEEGRLNIQRFLDLRKPPKKPPTARFKGRIVVENAEVRYTDRGASPSFLSDLDVLVGNIDLTADFARPEAIDYRLSADGYEAPFERMEAIGSAVLANNAVTANAMVLGADVPALYQRFAANPALDVVSGVADAQLNVCVVPGELVHYAVAGHVGGLAADVAALQGERVVASGDFTVTPAGVDLPRINLTALGSRIAGRGAVFDLASPTIDIEATATDVDLGRWAGLVPEVQEALPEITGTDRVRVAARIAGPLTAPDVRVAADFPREVRVAYPLPREPTEERVGAGELPEDIVLRATARGLSISAAVPDIETRDVKARVSFRELEVGDLSELLPEQDYLKQLTAAPLRDVSAELVYSRDTPATAGRLEIDRVETEHGPVEGLDIDYALAGRTIRADASAENLLGARLHAEGLIDLTEDPLSVYAQFDASNIDAAKVASIATLEEMGLSGTVAASGVAAIRGRELQAAAQVSGRRLTVQGIDVDEAAANIGLTREAADVRYLSASSPLGAVWARGQLEFGGPMDVEVAAANVPLDQVRAFVEERQQQAEEADDADDAERAEPVRLAGSAFVHGHVKGELKSPEVRADIAAFDVGADKWTAPVFAANVAGTPRSVRVTNALVRRGTAVASADLSLSDIAWPPGSFFSEEPPPEDPEAELPPLDGTLEGSVSLAGLDLSHLQEFVSLPDNVLLTGLVGANDIGIGGSLQAPRAEGPISLRHGKAALTDQGVAVGPLTVDADLLATRHAVTVRNASATSSAGSLALTAELSGWDAEEGPQLIGELTARDLKIGSYTPAEGVLARLDGAVDSVHATVAGPLSEPWPAVSAEVAAEEVRFGRRAVRDISAALSYQDGLLGARQVGCRLAGGEIEIPVASYRPADGKLFADARITGISAPQVLIWAGDLASEGQGDADAVRDRFYGFAHRLRGTIGADKLMVGNYLTDLWGTLEGLRIDGAEMDRKPVPDVEVGCRFSGLAAVSESPERGDPEAEPSSPLARLHVDDITVSSDLPAGYLTANGSIHWDGDVDLTAQADLVPVSVLEPWLPANLSLQGDVALTARARGPATDPEIRASIDVFNPTVAGLSFDLLQATRIDVTGDAIVMDGGLLKRGTHEMQVSGQLPFDRDALRLNGKGPIAFEAKMIDWPLQALVDVAQDFAERGAAASEESVWAQCKADGLLTASLNVSGILNTPEVRGYLSVERGATFHMASWPEQSRVEDIWLDAVLGPSPTGVGSMIEALNCHARLDRTAFDLKGRAELSQLAADRWLDNRIQEITIAATAEEQRLPGGTLARDIDARLKVFTDPTGWHVVKVEQATAGLGKGQATLTGAALIDTLQLDQLGHVPCDLRLRIDDGRIAYGKVVKRARVNGVIAARKFASRTTRPLPAWFLEKLPPDAPTDPAAPIQIVSLPVDRDTGKGSLTVTRAIIGLPGKKEPAAEEAGQEQPPEAGERFVIHGLPLSLPAPRMDVSVAIGPNVTVNTPIVEADVIPDARAIWISGTPQAPRIEAAAALRRGRLRLPRGNLNISGAEAEVTIQPATWLLETRSARRKLEITGRVSAHAEGTVRTAVEEDRPPIPVHVKLELAGGLPPGQLRDMVEVSSSPPLGESRIYELLALSPVSPGAQVAAGGETPLQEMLAGLVAQNLLEGVLHPLEEELTEALGLEEFEVIVGLDQPVELRVGKYLLKNLLASYHRTAGGPEDEFDLQLSYSIKDRYQVTYQTDEESRQQVRFEYRWQF